MAQAVFNYPFFHKDDPTKMTLVQGRWVANDDEEEVIADTVNDLYLRFSGPRYFPTWQELVVAFVNSIEDAEWIIKPTIPPLESVPGVIY